METNRGLKFAEQQLLRHGWEQGKGLGRKENGISEAIKVKVKCDKGGVGHKESEQFTFHWWDHVFNKASASLAVESDQNRVVVKKMKEEENGLISNKKPRKAMMNKSMLYGCFVKSATLLSGQEHPEQRLSVSEDSSSEDEEKLDLSSTKNLSDAELIKACGGRTAHKGARHGLKMSAKLARLEQQEQEFMAKYGKKKQTDKTTPLNEAEPNDLIPALDQERAEKTKHKKAKKKKHSHKAKENGVQDNVKASQEHNEEMKKRKKHAKHKADLESEDVTESFMDTDAKKKKKSITLLLEKESMEILQEGKVAEAAEDQPTDESVSKKKRKKKNHSEQSSALEEGQRRNTLLASEQSAETTESHEHEQQEEGTADFHPTHDVYKKKKKKSSKANKEKSPATEMLSCYSLDASTAEIVETADTAQEPSQSKKRKRREDELEAETENRSILENQPPGKKKKKKKKSIE